MSDINFVDSGALTPDYFATTDANGQWVPKAYTGSYGANGFHLDFSSGATAQSLGADSAPISGGHTMKNDWTVNGMSVAGNQMIDSPVNNFATMNPLNLATNGALKSGNLLQDASAGGNAIAGSSMLLTKGKWYWEVKYVNAFTSNGTFIGLSRTNISFAGQSTRYLGDSMDTI